MKMSNQSVTNTDYVPAAKFSRILFPTLYVVEFALSHFAFYTPPGNINAELFINTMKSNPFYLENLVLIPLVQKDNSA